MEFEQSRNLFEQHRYQEALEGFKICIQKNQNRDQVLSSFYYSLTIFQTIGQTDHYNNLQEQFVKYLGENQLYRQLNEEFSDAKDIVNKSTDVLRYAWKAAIEEGELERAKNISHILLERFWQSKNFSQGLQLIDEIKKRQRLDDRMIITMVRYYLLKGDNATAANELKAAVQGRRISITVVQEFFAHISDELIKRSGFNLQELYLQYLLEKTTYKSDIESRKKLMNGLFQAILQYPQNPVFLYHLLKYSIAYGREKLFEATKQYLRTQKLEWKRYKELKNEMDRLLSKEYKFEADAPLPQVDDEFVDMATDLFSESSLQAKSEFDQKRKMERAVEFLKEVGEAPLEISNEGQEQNTKNLSLDLNEPFSVNDMISGIEQSLEYFAKLIHKDLGHTASIENEHSDMRMRKYIAEGGVEVTEKNFKDLTIALAEMGMVNAAWKVIDEIEGKGISHWSLEKRIELRYLKIEILRQLSRLGEALAAVKEMLDTWALKEDELICFHYIAAEIYRDNGMPERALFHYKYVAQADSNYRMVTQRINEIVET